MFKPRHSAFFETSLSSLLAPLDVTRVVVIDAQVRRFESDVPKDTTASQNAERTARVLAHLNESCVIDTPVADEVVL